MILIGGRIFGNFFATRHVCVEINGEIGKKNVWVWHVQAF